MGTEDVSIAMQRRLSKIYKRMQRTKHNLDIADDNMGRVEENFKIRWRKH